MRRPDLVEERCEIVHIRRPPFRLGPAAAAAATAVDEDDPILTGKRALLRERIESPTETAMPHPLHEVADDSPNEQRLVALVRGRGEEAGYREVASRQSPDKRARQFRQPVLIKAWLREDQGPVDG